MSDKENIDYQIQKLQVDTMNAIEKLERELEEAKELLKGWLPIALQAASGRAMLLEKATDKFLERVK